jgi:hypothetical protein
VTVQGVRCCSSPKTADWGLPRDASAPMARTLPRRATASAFRRPFAGSRRLKPGKSCGWDRKDMREVGPVRSSRATWCAISSRSWMPPNSPPKPWCRHRTASNRRRSAQGRTGGILPPRRAWGFGPRRTTPSHSLGLARLRRGRGAGAYPAASSSTRRMASERVTPSRRARLASQRT